MIPPRQFLDHVVWPVLHALAAAEPRLHTPAAERLLLGTAVHESKLRDIAQRRGGPARSMFQIEPETFASIWASLEGRPALTEAVSRFVFRGVPPLQQLAGNQHLACAIARLVYWRARPPLPAADDIAGLGQYWKEHYNTRLGAGRPERFVKDWHQYCAEAF